jgi:hypothetical protein
MTAGFAEILSFAYPHGTLLLGFTPMLQGVLRGVLQSQTGSIFPERLPDGVTVSFLLLKGNVERHPDLALPLPESLKTLFELLPKGPQETLLLYENQVELSQEIHDPNAELYLQPHGSILMQCKTGFLASQLCLPATDGPSVSGQGLQGLFLEMTGKGFGENDLPCAFIPGPPQWPDVEGWSGILEKTMLSRCLPAGTTARMPQRL